MKYTHIFWDWNGTLLDDVGAALLSVNEMLERRGKETINLAQYQAYINTPIIKFYEHILDLEKEDYLQILKEYNDGYVRQLPGIELAQGAREALNRLHNSGIKQLIVSSCEQNQLNDFVNHFDVKHYFNAVLGSDDFYAGSKLERAKSYMVNNEINPQEVLVVGDLLHDYEMAKNIGADCVLCSLGHQSEEKLLTSGVRVINSINQIFECIE